MEERSDKWERIAKIGLWVLFFISSSMYLHRMPGLMGDEASEGQNVYELLTREEGITITGERSYIGPLIDYLRIPFIGAFGYTVLALRLPILMASLVLFWLGWRTFPHLFGQRATPIIIAIVFFSPIYFTQQRLGWAITLLPFFALLLMWLLLKPRRHRYLLVGLVAGVGLHTHIMFLPTLVAIAQSTLLWYWWPTSDRLIPWLQARWRGVLEMWPALIGFIAGFGTQFVVLQLQQDDQGKPDQVAALFSERWSDLPLLLPHIMSGSSFVARYTGTEYSSGVLQLWLWGVVVFAIVGFLTALVARGIYAGQSRKGAVLWTLGLLVHLLVLVYMIDRFTLRYFVVFGLGVWVLAGAGIAATIGGLLKRLGRPQWLPIAALILGGLLTIWNIGLVAWPFLNTGGSVADFSLGNRTDSAAALVDTRSLVDCLRGAESVSSENVHIFNRLLFLSHRYSDLLVVNEEQATDATLLVHYRDESNEVLPADELCPDLTHFVVERR